MPSIEQIPSYLVWPIRHQVMYPELSLEEVKLQNDDDGTHFGLFDHNKLITIVSVFQTDKEQEMQFRKFATLDEFQGMGYGSSMLKYVIDFAGQQGCTRLWCNARKNASCFYKKFGFKETTQTFTQNGYDFVIMELYMG